MVDAPTLAPDLLDRMDAYFRAANYLSVGQIYLFDNPLLKRPKDRRTFRAHQVPLSDPSTHPEHLALLEEWLRSHRPQELFDEEGRLKPELADLAPTGHRRMGKNPHANGGLLLKGLRMPDFREYAGRRADARRERRWRYSCTRAVPARRGEAEH